jgi:outer membrane protein assembly factor BamA
MRLTLSTPCAVGPWRRDGLLQAGRGGDALHPAPAQDGPRPAAAGGWITPYAEHPRLPYYQRFFLGGETQIRGRQHPHRRARATTNRPSAGTSSSSSTRSTTSTSDGPLRVLLFYDAGQAFAESPNINLRQLRTSTGAELRFIMPVLNVPFRLIYAWNLSRDSFQPARHFKFAVGTTF